MLTNIFAALGLIKEILDLARSIVSFIQENKQEQWFKDSAAAFGNFQQKTPEERKKLAKDISDLLGRM